MKPCFRFASLFLLACLLPAHALAERSATVESFNGEVIEVRLGNPPTAGGACVLGETRPATNFVTGYLAPPSDTYYTYLGLAGCTGCTPNVLQIQSAHVRLGFRSNCSIPVEIGVVGTLSGPPCPVPDPTNVICLPVRYELTGEEGVAYDFELALPEGCCISADAFLLVRFPDSGSCGDPNLLPALGAAATPCNTCFSYNDNPAFGFVDICTDPFWPSTSAGNPAFSAEADCCGVTPVETGTWGQVKSLYR